MTQSVACSLYPEVDSWGANHIHCCRHIPFQEFLRQHISAIHTQDHSLPTYYGALGLSEFAPDIAHLAESLAGRSIVSGVTLIIRVGLHRRLSTIRNICAIRRDTDHAMRPFLV